MLEIIIKRSEELTKTEYDQITVLGDEAFGLEDPNDMEWSETEWHVIGKLDGVIVSGLGIVVRDAQVGERSVRLGGIGGVATRPDFQRHGYAGLLLQTAAEFMHDRLDLPFALLICSPERMAYYGKFGWLPMEAPMVIEQRGQTVPYVGPVMILPISGDPWPAGDVDLRGKPW